MSFDPFETRLHFLQLLRKLNASQASIQKIVSYAIKYGSRCGEDLWECITEECSKGSLNTRINILYFLDNLLDTASTLSLKDAPYVTFIQRDLGLIVSKVVPETREGVLNQKSAKQILDSWRTRRMLDVDVIDGVLHELEVRKSGDESSSKKRGHEEAFSRNDILRRMEEDRERHKRLRERIWILPIPPLHQLPSSTSSSLLSNRNLTTTTPSQPSPSSKSTPSPFTPASPSSKRGTMPPPPIPPPPGTHSKPVLSTLDPLEVEFDQLWEGGGGVDQHLWEKMREDMRIAGLEIPQPP